MASYSFNDVTATIVGGGGSAILGAGAGAAKEGISCEFLEDKDNMLVGADGGYVHSLRPAKAGRATVRLLKSSPWNAVLTLMYNAQSLSTRLWGKNVLTVTNIVTGDNYVCTGVAFQKHPSITWAEDANYNEWTFNVGHMDPILGAGY
ncbi:DUF3277 family protein [Acidobacteria bacterium AB60]|nr:DUF3277 family protein [Acidobacteria bacterium AB60]